MARYLLLIYGNEQAWEAMSPQERKAHEAGHAAFVAAGGDAIIASHELQRTSAATSLRGGAGRPTPTDGPFLETKEALGGYYVVDVPDLDAAIALAEKLPEVAASHSGVEIRPIVERD